MCLDERSYEPPAFSTTRGVVFKRPMMDWDKSSSSAVNVGRNEASGVRSGVHQTWRCERLYIQSVFFQHESVLHGTAIPFTFYSRLHHDDRLRDSQGELAAT
jgi:hypothetical protein